MLNVVFYLDLTWDFYICTILLRYFARCSSLSTKHSLLQNEISLKFIFSDSRKSGFSKTTWIVTSLLDLFLYKSSYNLHTFSPISTHVLFKFYLKSSLKKKKSIFFFPSLKSLAKHNDKYTNYHCKL